MSRPDVYEARTGDVIVRARPTYLDSQSEPAEGRWVWAYSIEIENRGQEAIQLISRHWIIIDATGHVEQVRGPGVVGEQPVIAPGDTFLYASGCPLPTPSGSMSGRYQMVRADGESFEAVIPTFSLHTPDARSRLN